uniref:MAM domain-containing protein n=1 Tax=Globodera pallida TaxID=36090 RepID=A0A183CG60_GLOPA
MPGYEYERSRLRQYLGIEWVPAPQPRNVRHPSELNCDFSKPELCKWRNVRGGGLDTLDFYLFRKEDNTEFPVVQVRPGPSKVSAGDQVLLTGDRKREEQIALLASHPIKCQNTTGKLTFTFWVYNGARIEVLILEDREDEGLHALPEKPQIDCGTCILQNDGMLKLKTWNNGNARLSVCIVRAHSMEILDCQNVVIEDGRTEEETFQQPMNLLNFCCEQKLQETVTMKAKLRLTPSNLRLKFVRPSLLALLLCMAFKTRHLDRLYLSPPIRCHLTTLPHILCQMKMCADCCHAILTMGACTYFLFTVAVWSFNRSAFSMLFGRNKVAMIESSQFHLNAPARLHFDFIIQAFFKWLILILREKKALQICTLSKTLSENDRKVYIIARLSNGARKASVQIDNLLLTDIGNHRAC